MSMLVVCLPDVEDDVCAGTFTATDPVGDVRGVTAMAGTSWFEVTGVEPLGAVSTGAVTTPSVGNTSIAPSVTLRTENIASTTTRKEQDRKRKSESFVVESFGVVI